MICRVKKNVIKNLLIVCISITLFSCSTPFYEASKLKPTTPVNSSTLSPKVFQPKQTVIDSSASPASAISSGDEGLIPASTQVIPSVITSEEVALREKQVEIAKEVERLQMLEFEAGRSTRRNLLQVKYSRLDSEIRLLQAKQLLQLKQQQDKTSCL